MEPRASQPEQLPCISSSQFQGFPLGDQRSCESLVSHWTLYLAGREKKTCEFVPGGMETEGARVSAADVSYPPHRCTQSWESPVRHPQIGSTDKTRFQRRYEVARQKRNVMDKSHVVGLGRAVARSDAEGGAAQWEGGNSLPRFFAPPCSGTVRAPQLAMAHPTTFK